MINFSQIDFSQIKDKSKIDEIINLYINIFKSKSYRNKISIISSPYRHFRPSQGSPPIPPKSPPKPITSNYNNLSISYNDLLHINKILLNNYLEYCENIFYNTEKSNIFLVYSKSILNNKKLTEDEKKNLTEDEKKILEKNLTEDEKKILDIDEKIKILLNQKSNLVNKTEDEKKELEHEILNVILNKYAIHMKLFIIQFLDNIYANIFANHKKYILSVDHPIINQQIIIMKIYKIDYNRMIDVKNRSKSVYDLGEHQIIYNYPTASYEVLNETKLKKTTFYYYSLGYISNINQDNNTFDIHPLNPLCDPFDIHPLNPLYKITDFLKMYQKDISFMILCITNNFDNIYNLYNKQHIVCGYGMVDSINHDKKCLIST